MASVGEMLEHPQTHARDMVIEVEHETAGTVRSLGPPVKMSASTPEPGAGKRSGAPTLGQHTREVLLEAGLREVEVDRLMAASAPRTRRRWFRCSRARPLPLPLFVPRAELWWQDHRRPSETTRPYRRREPA